MLLCEGCIACSLEAAHIQVRSESTTHAILVCYNIPGTHQVLAPSCHASLCFASCRAFSPLEGFMNQENYDSVVSDMRLKVCPLSPLCMQGQHCKLFLQAVSTFQYHRSSTHQIVHLTCLYRLTKTPLLGSTAHLACGDDSRHYCILPLFCLCFASVFDLYA